MDKQHHKDPIKDDASSLSTSVALPEVSTDHMTDTESTTTNSPTQIMTTEEAFPPLDFTVKGNKISYRYYDTTKLQCSIVVL